ncbi:MAG: tRNA (adenosine(37)-N6)-threonylcarbamoyltransferase complex ATPase subunit type 1 TsaE [Firmicutes bacterium]|nr:tRNA (adenosine(37)-N6)-threonylcarbamoyltransferase complex ATPase subunit type 1 TsaE [Bacillota bacterium]
MTFESFSEKETFEIGKKLGETALPGSIYALVGDLGVGKTVIAKGVAEGLGVVEDIVSPTFTIVREYSGRLPYYHFDIYRIEDEEELLEIGWDEYIGLGGVCLVEWADLVEEAMPPDTIWVRIGKDLAKGVEYRKITIEGSVYDHLGN